MEDTISEAWSQLKPIVHQLLSSEGVSEKAWMNAIHQVYVICVSADDMTYLSAKMKDALDSHALKLAEKLKETSSNNLLSIYNSLWNKYSEMCKYLDILLGYYNDQHGMDEDDKTSHLTIRAWETIVLRSTVSDIIVMMLEGITQERNFEFNKKLECMRGVVDSFDRVADDDEIEISRIYMDNFEEPLLVALGQYYKKESSRMLQEHGTIEYMEKVIPKMQEEIDWSSKLLKKESINQVMELFIESFITSNKDAALSECQQLLVDKRTDKLASLYKFLKYVPGYDFQEMKKRYENHVEKEVLANLSNLTINKGEDINSAFITKLVECHKKYRKIVKETFDDDYLFVEAFDTAFAHASNQDLIKCEKGRFVKSAEMLAKYCDSLLRSSNKKMPEADLEETLGYVIQAIFPYIDDKDMFEKFYLELLAKRLLLEARQMDLEECMVNLFRQSCGFEYANKLSVMITDIGLSKELSKEFTEKHDVSIRFTVKVAKCSVWPINKNAALKFTLPIVLERVMSQFDSFYRNKFNGRQLNWIHHFSQCELKINMTRKNKTYFVMMNTYQMAILLLFQNTDALSFSSIKECLGLDEKVLAKNIATVVDSKLLDCDTELVGAESNLTFNTSFSKTNARFRIAGSSKRVTQEEKEAVLKTLGDDRKMYIQAMVVRIMKHHKQMKHNELFAEVCAQSKARFTVTAAMLKKEIEKLIEKDFLKRAPESKTIYHYLA